jgi:hypothetical protein
MIYPINIEKNSGRKAEVLQAGQTVQAWLMAKASENNSIRIIAVAAMDSAVTGKDQSEMDSTLENRILAFVFKTSCDGKDAFHEITAGIKDMPLAALLNQFDPATEWGKNLHGYRGGELVVDEQDEHVHMARERMVLSVPWYAWGTPVQDISKYEVTEYTHNSVKVNWKVTKSGNHSVFEDFGYVLFKEVSVGHKKQTLILFNSLHRFEVGWLARMLPEILRDILAKKSLKDTFTGHIKNYLKIIGISGRS